MPNETQDLVFNLKANTSNAEQGMGKVNRLTDDLKITTEKTSGALRDFGNQLKTASDLSDVAGMATKALGQVLGASLGGTAVLVAGKALIDAFNTVQNAVKETENKVKDAFKEIDKAGFPKTFEEGASQADKLSSAADAVSKKIQEIESNPLQKFIAGITGAKEKMDELVLSTQAAAQEKIKLGVQTAIADEEFQRSLSEKDKALNALYKSYQEKSDKIVASMLAAGADPSVIKQVVDEIYTAHAGARNKMLDDYALKEYAVEEENARKTSDLKRSLAMSEFDLEEKSKERLRERERQNSKEQLETMQKAIEEENKKREEGAKKIEEYQNKLVSLTEKRVALEEKIASINEQIDAKKAQLATQAAGLGGTLRGEGQTPTSYEIGFNKKVERARADAQRAGAELAKRAEQNRQLAAKGYDPSKMTQAQKNAIVSPEKVQQALKQSAIQDAENKAKKEGVESLDKLNNKLDESKQQLSDNNSAAAAAQVGLSNLASAANNAVGPLQSIASIGAGGGSAGKQSIYLDTTAIENVLNTIIELLYNNFTELKTYAHAT